MHRFSDRTPAYSKHIAVRVCAVTAGLVISTEVRAQYWVEEILAKGGQLMSAAQIEAEYIGPKITGVNELGHSFELRYYTDGTLRGSYTTPGGTSETRGVWSINERNQLCSGFIAPRTDAITRRCAWLFKVGSEYYSTNTRTDDTAAAEFVECLTSGSRECKGGGFVVTKRTLHR